MKDILKRDITGECVGECRDIVREAEQDRQAEIESVGLEGAESFPSVSAAISNREN